MQKCASVRECLVTQVSYERMVRMRELTCTLHDATKHLFFTWHTLIDVGCTPNLYDLHFPCNQSLDLYGCYREEICCCVMFTLLARLQTHHTVAYVLLHTLRFYKNTPLFSIRILHGAPMFKMCGELSRELRGHHFCEMKDR